MILTFLIWAFEAVTALAISGAVTAAAIFVGLTMWLHSPRVEARQSNLQPIYAVDETGTHSEG